MYSIYCLDCYKYYVGQTFRYLNIKFKEYLKNLKKTDGKSLTVQQILQTNHNINRYKTIK